jgi:RND family efflux transporter MFP subunit
LVSNASYWVQVTDMARLSRRARVRGRGLAGLAMALLLASCGGEPAGGAQAEKERDEVKPVVTARPTFGPLEDTFLEREATLLPVAEATISTRQEGFVLSLLPEVGDVLHAGDRIAELDRTDSSLLLAELRASLMKTKANLENQKRSWERVVELHEKQVASDEQRDEAQTALDRAQAEFEEARARVERQEQRDEELTILAPMPGIISKLHSEAGEYLERGDPIVEMKRIDTVIALCTINERYLTEVREGSPAVVHVTAYPDRVFEGLVWKVIGEALVESRSFPVKVLLPNADLELKPGMSARVGFKRSLDEALFVPKDAVIEEDGDAVVYVVEEGVAKRRRIEVGASLDERWHVRAGLAVDELVVVQGNEDLEVGDRVRMVELPPPGPPTLPTSLEAERSGAAGS